VGGGGGGGGGDHARWGKSSCSGGRVSTFSKGLNRSAELSQEQKKATMTTRMEGRSENSAIAKQGTKQGNSGAFKDSMIFS